MSVANNPAATGPVGSCFYFGCVRECGHYLYDENLRRCFKFPNPTFTRFARGWLDGAFLDRKSQQWEGLAVVAYWQMFTFLQFWDRSVDKRRGSNSTFVIPERTSFERALELCKQRFPSIWERFTFPVVFDRHLNEPDVEIALALIRRS